MKPIFHRLGLLGLILTGIGLTIIYRDQFNITHLQTWLDQAGIAAPLVFMLIYMIGTVLFLPGSLLTLAGGALFGPAWGTIYNLTGATLGAMISFLAARYVAATWVEKKAGPALQQLLAGVEAESWRFVAFTRLVPLFPFNGLNYALGLTRIGFWPYSITTYITMLPGAMAYTWLGYAGKEALAGSESMESIIRHSLIALALLAIVIFLPRWVSRMRRHYPPDSQDSQ